MFIWLSGAGGPLQTRLDDRLDLETSKALDLGPSKSFTFSYWNQNKTLFGGGCGTVTTFNPYMKQPWRTMVNETLLGVIIQVGSFLHSLYATWSSSVWCNLIHVQMDSVSSTTLLLGHVEATYWYLRPNRCDPSLCFFSTILRLMEDIRSTNWHSWKHCDQWSVCSINWPSSVACCPEVNIAIKNASK